MGLTPERVRLLVAQERDHRDLERFRLNFVATENVRAFVERELQRDPELTHAKLAEFLGMRQIDLERQLGYEPRTNGSFQRRIGVAAASQLMIASVAPRTNSTAAEPSRARRRTARHGDGVPGTRRPWPRPPAGSAGARPTASSGREKKFPMRGGLGACARYLPSGGPFAAFGR